MTLYKPNYNAVENLVSTFLHNACFTIVLLLWCSFLVTSIKHVLIDISDMIIYLKTIHFSVLFTRQDTDIKYNTHLTHTILMSTESHNL